MAAKSAATDQEKPENVTRQAAWRQANSPKYLAHLAVQRAIHAGELRKGGCEVCGSPKVDAHHDHYDRPLHVRWLCRSHHVRLHLYGEDMFPAVRDPRDGRAG